jgi:hypothetical protein
MHKEHAAMTAAFEDARGESSLLSVRLGVAEGEAGDVAARLEALLAGRDRRARTACVYLAANSDVSAGSACGCVGVTHGCVKIALTVCRNPTTGVDYTTSTVLQSRSYI